MRVAAIVPAYNEENRIASTLKAIQEIPEINVIRVVNDGSTDRTAEIARESGVEVVNLTANVGKGEAINRGVRGVEADVFIFLDADLGDTAREAARILRPVLNGEADLCVARFPPPKKKGGIGMVKRLAAWGIAREGMIAREPLSGQRAMTSQVLQDILPFHSGFGIEVGMTIRALRRGYRIIEVPVQMSHAETGRNLKGFIHRGRQFLDVARVILAENRR
ncbi:MAG: glycosyltransferase family 2 protein [Syntrophomonadaceae bacterium]|jgi:glycosyltransferase involved in cell wall biosynthesis|nr:glycosyltransferase family 2 protein [Syntrophomonadaceae bacterium]